MKLVAHPRVIERGILTSVYKREIKQNVSQIKQNPLSRIKYSIIHQHEKLQSQTGMVLQVSLFAIVLAVILF